jgi:hypothetical protein
MRSAWSDVLRLAAALLPAVGTIVVLPGFQTQDGPAHVYNAEILHEALFRPGSGDFRLAAYEVRFQPLPNWAGHAGLIALLGAVSPRVANQAMIVLTLVGTSGGALLLARTVAGGPLSWSIVLLCALLGLNLPWLFGFSSFLLGSILFLITPLAWWRGRERPGPGLALQLALLVTLGYFCHPISLGLTVLALGLLVLTTPGPSRARRALWTVCGLAPLVPLAGMYLRLMSAGGRPAPAWAGFSRGFGPSALLERLLWVDPITIGRRTALPFAGFESRWLGLAAPALWLAIGLALLLLERRHDPRSDRPGISRGRPWFLLAGVLLTLGFLAPDSLGPTHGHYLTQRVVWMGLLALVPGLAVRHSSATPRATRRVRLGAFCLGLALVVQTAFLAEYAVESNRLSQAYFRAVPAVGQRQRVAGLFLDLRGRFRANPRVHLDCWLGVGTQNIIWSNYEAAYYYFPVRLRPDRLAPPVREFEAISILDRPEDAERRRHRWSTLLEEFHPVIDRLVLWGRDEGIEQTTSTWYDRTVLDGPLQVWSHRGTPGEGESRR